MCTEPNAPPADVRGHNRSSTSILVQWGEVPANDQNGIILSYTVTYKALPNGIELTKNVTAPTTQATLADLTEYTNYSITVFASTAEGVGNVSAAIIVITDEDSKYRVYCHVFITMTQNLRIRYDILPVFVFLV